MKKIKRLKLKDSVKLKLIILISILCYIKLLSISLCDVGHVNRINACLQQHDYDYCMEVVK